ncbi:MAG: hypothetical protein ACRC1K_16895 [Planctomycetia bacterium]
MSCIAGIPIRRPFFDVLQANRQEISFEENSLDHHGRPPLCAIAVVVETARDRAIEAVSDAKNEDTAVSSSPTTETSTLTKDLGAVIVAPHSSLRFPFEMENSQTIPVEIERVSITMPCCVSLEAPPKLIAPGETARFHLVAKTNGRSGKLRFEAILAEKNGGRFRLVGTATVHNRISVDPQAVDLGSIGRDELLHAVPTQKFRVFRRSSEPISRLEIENPPGGSIAVLSDIDFHETRTTDETSIVCDEYLGSWKFLETGSDGLHDARASASIAGSTESVVATVRWRVAGRVTASPASLYFTSDGERRKTVRVTAVDGQPLSVQELSADEDYSCRVVESGPRSTTIEVAALETVFLKPLAVKTLQIRTSLGSVDVTVVAGTTKSRKAEHPK